MVVPFRGTGAIIHIGLSDVHVHIGVDVFGTVDKAKLLN